MGNLLPQGEGRRIWRRLRPPRAVDRSFLQSALEPTMSDDSTKLDVLIAGAGYVGLAAAVSLKQARPSLAVAVVDAAPEGVWKNDGRASAIAAAACRMLDRLGVWEKLAPQAQAITDM